MESHRLQSLIPVNMKEVLIGEGPLVHHVDSPIPTPAHDQVLIKVEVSSTNPKDWKTDFVPRNLLPINMGDDFAGTVHSVGQGVTGFSVSWSQFGFLQAYPASSADAFSREVTASSPFTPSKAHTAPMPNTPLLPPTPPPTCRSERPTKRHPPSPLPPSPHH